MRFPSAFQDLASLFSCRMAVSSPGFHLSISFVCAHALQLLQHPVWFPPAALPLLPCARTLRGPGRGAGHKGLRQRGGAILSWDYVLLSCRPGSRSGVSVTWRNQNLTLSLFLEPNTSNVPGQDCEPCSSSEETQHIRPITEIFRKILEQICSA